MTDLVLCKLSVMLTSLWIFFWMNRPPELYTPCTVWYTNHFRNSFISNKCRVILACKLNVLMDLPVRKQKPVLIIYFVLYKENKKSSCYRTQNNKWINLIKNAAFYISQLFCDFFVIIITSIFNRIPFLLPVIILFLC